jgi:O-antigen/teichoic acid export membrane protein
MQINKKDLFWNYGATFFKIGSSVLLLPLILRKLPPEMVGIWSIFITITAFSSLLDFGFNPSFARNITYIFSGVKKLTISGFDSVQESENQVVDYGLLKGVINAMRWFYLRMAFFLLVLLSTVGTYYIHHILKSYKGDAQEIYIAWVVLCIINTYNIFTLYYDSLLQGKGLVKRVKQIDITGYLVYLIISSLLILSGFGIIAIVSAQASSVIIIRWLSHKSFYTAEVIEQLKDANAISTDEIIQTIYPNAIKIGLTSLGGFVVQRAGLIIGSLYLSLTDIASYGISMQLIGVGVSLAGIYTATYIPKIVQFRVENNVGQIKRLYINGQIVLVSTFILFGFIIVFLGQWGIGLIGSQTVLMSKKLLCFAVLVSLLECNHAVAGNIILTKNEVPFFKASLLSGLGTIILLLLLFTFFDLGMVSMIIAPAIAQGIYQNWKWPMVVKKDLDIQVQDYIHSFKVLR